MKRFQDRGALNNKYGFIWICDSSTSTKLFHLRKKYEEVNLKFINARELNADAFSCLKSRKA
jgi:hypothetical protein